MEPGTRLMAAAAVASVLAHLALVTLVPAPGVPVADDAPLAVELREESPPPAAIPPRRLPPKAKAVRAAPPPSAPANRETPTAALPDSGEAPTAPAEPPAADSQAGPAAAAPPAETNETPTAEVPADEAPALLAVKGLAKSADLRFNLIRGEGKVGEVAWKWRLDGNRYSIETIGTASGLAAMFVGGEYRQTSEGTVGANGLQPQRYRFEKGSAEKTDTVEFDWAAGKATSTDAKGKVRQLELVPGTQDLMSFLHQLPLLPADAISIPLATIKKLKDYSFSAPKTVKVTVPAGELDAYYYQRIGAETEAEVWLQHQPPYLPIRIRLFDKLGNKFEQVLTHIEYQP